MDAKISHEQATTPVADTAVPTVSQGAAPAGVSLAFRIWHRLLRLLLLLHVPALAVFGYFREVSEVGLSAVAVPLVLVLVAGVGSERFRAAIVAVGLVSCTWLLVLWSGGAIEAHFHGLIVIGLVALYRDAVALGIAAVGLAAMHVVVAPVDATLVYNNPAAIDSPLPWAFVNLLAIIGVVAVPIFSWRGTAAAERASAAEATSEAFAEAEVVRQRQLADVYATVARRSQNLLGRQIDVIEQLEQEERDPQTLGKLFVLDHLATRMNREAASMLVLAGEEPNRRVIGAPPMSEVGRGAIGEIEDYNRVTLVLEDDRPVAGRAVAALVHLLSELLENAASYSPPDARVELRGRGLPDGDYEMRVIDRGLGLDDESLATYNHLLSHPPTHTPSDSQRLGLDVVARLAGRAGLSVRLERNTSSAGLTAVVHIPAKLLAGDPRTAARAPAPAASTHPASAHPVSARPVPNATPASSTPPGPVPSTPRQEPRLPAVEQAPPVPIGGPSAAAPPQPVGSHEQRSGTPTAHGSAATVDATAEESVARSGGGGSSATQPLPTARSRSIERIEPQPAAPATASPRPSGSWSYDGHLHPDEAVGGHVDEGARKRRRFSKGRGPEPAPSAAGADEPPASGHTGSAGSTGPAPTGAAPGTPVPPASGGDPAGSFSSDDDFAGLLAADRGAGVQPAPSGQSDSPVPHTPAAGSAATPTAAQGQPHVAPPAATTEPASGQSPWAAASEQEPPPAGSVPADAGRATDDRQDDSSRAARDQFDSDTDQPPGDASGAAAQPRPGTPGSADTSGAGIAPRQGGAPRGVGGPAAAALPAAGSPPAPRAAAPQRSAGPAPADEAPTGREPAPGLFAPAADPDAHADEPPPPAQPGPSAQQQTPSGQPRSTRPAPGGLPKRTRGASLPAGLRTLDTGPPTRSAAAEPVSREQSSSLLSNFQSSLLAGRKAAQEQMDRGEVGSDDDDPEEQP